LIHSPAPIPPDAPGDLNITGGNVNITGDLAHTKIVNIQAETAYDVRGCENPYLGLAAFTYADAKKYAGREKLIAETVARITNPASPIPLLFVTGASGSGKSSFAQAGLLPALETFYANFTVKRAVMRPAGDPFAALNDALWRQLRVTETLGVSENPKGLLEQTPPNQINLLVLDQFEEFFTQAPQAAREQFFAFLVNLPPVIANGAKQSPSHTHIIATLRADYLPELFNHPALYEIAKRGVDLRAMNADELKQAIEQPLRASPYAQTKHFEPALVDKLAADAAHDAAYLPLLQVTLQELWRKGSLKLEAYSNLTDALKQRADQVLEYRDFDDAVPGEKRDPAEQAALLNLLLDLVDVSADDDQRRDVRKQRTKAELTRNDITRTRLVDELAAARLLSVQQESTDANRIEVDLIHETLLTNWARLQTAIAERRGELRQRARFEQNLDEWTTAKLSAPKRADDYLLEGVRLAEARELAARGDVALRNQEAQAYLRASIAKAEAAQQAELERERQRAEALEQAKRAAEKSAAAEKQRGRILRIAAVGLTVLLLAAVAALYFAFQQQNVAVNEANQRGTAEAKAVGAAQTAEAEAKRAQEQARISQAKSLAAQSISQRDQNLALAYLLGIQAFNVKSDTAEARSNLFNLRFEDSHPRGFLWGHTSWVTSVAYSPDDKTLASGSCAERERIFNCIAGTILLWDVATQTRVGELKGHTNDVESVAYSPDGKTLASGSRDKTILLWDVATQTRVGELKGHTDWVTSVAYSPDGKTLASRSCGERESFFNCKAGAILLWDVATQTRVGELKGHTDYVTSVAYSPDGKTLASGSCAERDSNFNCKAGTILLWDVATQTRVGELKGHRDNVTSVAYSPDGKTLASGSRDNTILLWDVDEVSWRKGACKIVKRNFTHAEYAQYISRAPGAYDNEYAKNPTCPEFPVER